MPSHVFENHPLNNGGGYEVLTYLRQSWIQTPPPPSWTAFSRKVTSSRPLEIDVDRPVERIEKISRACLFVPRDPTNSTTVFPVPCVESLSFSGLFPHTHRHTYTRKNARARTWFGHVPRIRFFVWLYRGRLFLTWRANASERFRRLEKCRSKCITGIEGFSERFSEYFICLFFLDSFINFFYIRKIFIFIHTCITEKNSFANNFGIINFYKYVTLWKYIKCHLTKFIRFY